MSKKNTIDIVPEHISEIKLDQNELIVELYKTIQRQEEEIKSLKTQTIKSPQEISPERLICEMEIVRLRETTKQRELTRDEVFKFDTLVNDLIKIKRLEKDLEETPEDHSVDLSDEELIKLVKNG